MWLLDFKRQFCLMGNYVLFMKCSQLKLYIKHELQLQNNAFWIQFCKAKDCWVIEYGKKLHILMEQYSMVHGVYWNPFFKIFILTHDDRLSVLNFLQSSVFLLFFPLIQRVERPMLAVGYVWHVVAVLKRRKSIKTSSSIKIS